MYKKLTAMTIPLVMTGSILEGASPPTTAPTASTLSKTNPEKLQMLRKELRNWEKRVGAKPPELNPDYGL